MKAICKYIISTFAIIFLTVLGVNAWQGLTAQTGDKLDYTKWNELVNTVQSGRIPGEVAAFNLATCPTGWSAYTPAVGRTIIGVGNGAGNNTALGDTLGDKSKPSLSDSIITVGIPVSSNITGNTNQPSLTNKYLAASSGGSIGANMWANINTSPITLDGVTAVITGGGTAPDNMQPSVALLYCVKN